MFKIDEIPGMKVDDVSPNFLKVTLSGLVGSHYP